MSAKDSPKSGTSAPGAEATMTAEIQASFPPNMAWMTTSRMPTTWGELAVIEIPNNYREVRGATASFFERNDGKPTRS